MNTNTKYFFLALVFFLGIRAYAQNIPNLKDIVNRVRTNSLPAKSYSVDISQTVNASGNSSLGNSIASGTVLEKNTFSAGYTPTEGLHIIKADNAKSQTQANVSPTSSSSEKGNVKLTVNLNTVFKDFVDWQNVNITLNKLNGSQNYLITGTFKIINFKIWVDTQNYYVSRLTFAVNGREFAQTDFTCKLVNNKYWLPSEIKMDHTMDGSEITQKFGTYKFQ